MADVNRAQNGVPDVGTGVTERNGSGPQRVQPLHSRHVGDLLARLTDAANWKRRTTAVFISYRREITSGEARALYNSFLAQLGRNSTIFIDVNSIRVGHDFRKELQDTLNSCDLMLVLIGREWADLKDERGRTRLEDPDDYVRLEIEMALKRDIRIAPVLVQGACMPAPAQLPSEMQDLVYRNSFVLSHERWDSDVRELIRRLFPRTIDPTPKLWRVGLMALALLIIASGIVLIKVLNTPELALPPGQIFHAKEPNDNIYQANVFDFGGTIQGQITSDDRVDWYAFKTPEKVGENMLVVCRWIDYQSLIGVTVYDKNERAIGYVSDYHGTKSMVIPIQKNQTYYVKVARIGTQDRAKYELSVRNPS